MSDKTNVSDESIPVNIVIGDVQEAFPAAMITEKGKGKAAGTVRNICLLKLDLSSTAGILKVATAVGVGQFVQCVWREVIRPACIEATSEAMVETPLVDAQGQPVLDEDGNPMTEEKFSPRQWAKSFISQFAAAERRSGPKLSEITARMAEISVELLELTTKPVAEHTPEDKMKLMRLIDEVGKLAKAREAKQGIANKAKAARAAKVATQAPA